jgi:hypothetical protein
MTLADKHSIHILHVVGGMVRGDPGTWLSQGATIQTSITQLTVAKIPIPSG